MTKQNTVTYSDAKARKCVLDAACRTCADELNATRARLAQRLGISASGPMGLTPDAIRQHPDYRPAKQAFDSAFESLRRFNAWYTRQFKGEIRADRQRRRATPSHG